MIKYLKMETEDYWIYENKIIFKPNFSNKLDTYFDIIYKYNELIFSNYNDYNITIKTNNKYYEEYDKNIIYSYFNQQLTIPQSVTHLTFGWRFNQPEIIPQNVTHLTFGHDFNQPIIIPQNITYLTFGWKFNQHVIILQIKVNNLILYYNNYNNQN